MRIEESDVEAVVIGGAILGGGGGGWIDEGRRLGRAAVERGFSRILSIDEVPGDAVLVTVSMVGAPSAGASVVRAEDYARAVELLADKTGTKIGGLISSEIGAVGAVNGWVQSAVLGIPLIDAPCNGRAHPLGLMGSMGLARDQGYRSIQTVVGGSSAKGNRVEAIYEGALADVSRQVLEAAVRAGGMAAVARNPVAASFVKDNGAPGAVRMARDAGKTFLARMAEPSAPGDVIASAASFFGGRIVGRGVVEEFEMSRDSGLDAGTALLRGGDGSFELTFWNEYLTLERSAERLATFPDLIMTFDPETAAPLISAQLAKGREAVVIVVPARRLKLGAGMRDPGLFRLAEGVVGKELLRFLG